MKPSIGTTSEGKTRRTWSTRRCKFCGTAFKHRLAEQRPDRGKYCSKRCRCLSMRRRTTLTCVWCKAEFIRGTAEVARHKDSNYCSWDCYVALRRSKARSYPKIGERHAHRVIAEQKIGRKLRKGEIVHHRDGNCLNFDPNNLEVLKNRSAHAAVHRDDISRAVTASNRRRAKK